MNIKSIRIMRSRGARGGDSLRFICSNCGGGNGISATCFFSFVGIGDGGGDYRLEMSQVECTECGRPLHAFYVDEEHQWWWTTTEREAWEMVDRSFLPRGIGEVK